LLSYTLPAEPSSKRVLVWRHLRKAGAILDAGVWLLPDTESTRVTMDDIVAEIRDLGGRAIAFQAGDLSEDQRLDLRGAYNGLRIEEYEELLQRCRRFQTHVERLIEAGNFKFGSVEELEEDLEKRRRSLAQLIVRDVFGVKQRLQVEGCITDCEAALARFIELAYLAWSGSDKGTE
jgi:hypothetical protein